MPETNIIPNGALIDDRPAELKQKDYKAEDLLIAAAALPFGNAKPTALGATLYSQWYTSSCVPHGFLTQLEYEGIVPKTGLSQLRAYRKRLNYPNPGSGAVDIYSQIRDGHNENSNAPVTPNMNEVAANAMAYLRGAKLIPEFNYYGFDDFSLVPQSVAAGKAIAIFIFATEEEWSQEYVTIRKPDLNIMDAYVRHCVCVIPKGDFTENGEKWLAVQDSAAFGNRHLRYVRLDFFLKRCYYASQVYIKGAAPVPPTFQYTFKKQLRYQSPTNDANEVKQMQRALQVLKRPKTSTPYMIAGLFGPFGPQTKKALGDFQTDNGIKDPDGQGTNFGPQTRKKMNESLLSG